jgi:hypothetical protein
MFLGSSGRCFLEVTVADISPAASNRASFWISFLKTDSIDVLTVTVRTNPSGPVSAAVTIALGQSD